MERIDENIVQVGHVVKSHGVHGELSLSVDNEALFDATCIIIRIDGLFVPFYVESSRKKSSCVAIVKLEGINSDADVQHIIGSPIFLKKDFLPDSTDDWDSFEGYKIYNKGKLVGDIVAIDDQTENELFVVKGASGEVLIPIVDEWVIKVDDVSKFIQMELPDGLIEE